MNMKLRRGIWYSRSQNSRAIEIQRVHCNLAGTNCKSGLSLFGCTGTANYELGGTELNARFNPLRREAKPAVYAGFVPMLV